MEEVAMQRILVALDGSEQAEKALELASDLASKYGAELLLLHVLSDKRLSDAERQMAEVEYLDELTSADDMSGLLQERDPRAAIQRLLRGSSALTHRFREALGKRLMETASRKARQGGVAAIETLLEDGDPAEQILRAAAERKADMIVMGSRGLGAAKGLLMGSVSHKVTQLAECTCVTVK
jgi:nucleotide-binding universal stress UspA family protein